MKIASARADQVRIPLPTILSDSALEAHGFGLERFIECALRMEDNEAVAPNRSVHSAVSVWDALERHGV